MSGPDAPVRRTRRLHVPRIADSRLAPLVGRLRARWARVPLRVRLVGIITVLLTVGLVVAGVTTATLLQRYLVGRVDKQLETEALSLANRQLDALQRNGCNQGGTSLLPSDYTVIFRIAAGTGQDATETVQDCGRSVTYQESGEPRLPTLTPTEVDALGGEPFTVPSTRSDSSWRVVAYPLLGLGGVYTGTVTVGLPLGGIQQTVERIVLLLVSSGAVIIVIGALGGGWAVRRSLRPLREIEDTAAAIAAGDMTRRVPAAPPSTEVGRLGEALNGMLTQIEQAFDARTASEGRMRRFVADASHELRTPLAAIRGYGELYRMGALTEHDQVDDTMRRIEQSATRMGGLVEDLLALARLDERRPLRSDQIDLAVLAADSISDLHALDPDRPLKIQPIEGTDGLRSCTAVGDERMLRQVLSNLVGNVVAHTPAGSPVEIALGSRDGSAILEVRDHGPGIDPEHAARVFERFYRVDASRSRNAAGLGTGGGAGLGMAIVAAIVEAHDGDVEIEQTPGGGTTVRVSLPVVGPGSPPAGPVSASPGAARA
ncbi:MAG TPA: HAMP domain-containing sensor histidine kinase [Cellulomonas sp.]|uniref:sensor histidine kinase n=1 Tax=Cellulomonas sp. TaxID=40001 RepID=UPI002E3612B6|nr:HAMP domain-containing sensor histidine kinase [Cellulomonas sp.]HEX5332061.1 HAMP domain-containing sensor histidine kinase [Cellulomonas sp.]